MHILIIPSWYKTPNNPVTGTFFEEQVRMLQKRGHFVGVLYHQHNLRFLGNSRYKTDVKVDNFCDDGVPTYYSFSQSYIPKIDTPCKIDILQASMSAYKNYKKYVKKNGKPDVIHGHSVVWGGVVARYISKKENIPYFITKHYTGWIIEPRRFNSKSFIKLLIQTVANSKKTFVVSSYYKNKLLEKYALEKNKLKVIPNIVNPIFYINRSKIKIKEPFSLVIVAYLVERKNHIILFKAIKLLKKRGLFAKLTVVGNGTNENKLKDFVKKNGLEKEIVFKGLLSRHEILDVLKESNAVISSSTFETFGVNIIEGLAIGRPCVVFDSGGPRDIMRSKDGILVSENSSYAFANAIQDLYNNYNNYNQKEISDSCNFRFGENTIYRSLYSEYIKV